MDAMDLERKAREAFELGYQAHMEGRVENAIYHYAHSLEWAPSPEAHTYLGWAFSFQMRFEAAINECRKAIALDPDYGNAHNDLGAYLIELGRPDEALEHLERALSAPRYDTPHYAHFNLGRAYERLGQPMAALDQYHRSLAKQADFAPAKQALRRMGRPMAEPGHGH